MELATQEQVTDFSSFITKYREKLAEVYAGAPCATTFDERHWPRSIIEEIQKANPLSAFTPTEYGGRGGHVWEALSMLEESSYQSLPLSLTFGINGALFIQPVAKYGDDDMKRRVLRDFMVNGKLGGLMITEPEYGSDALSMQTHFVEEGNSYRVSGTKHWAGLTGMADYWLITARQKDERGLGRDIHFFVTESAVPEQEIVVEEYYPSLGLYMIPYGRNRIEVRVPKSNRLVPESTGVRMLLDTLHRSRTQFPGMGMGFLRRIFDDALEHCKTRNVGGQSLLNYDQVKSRLATIQAYTTTCAAMCAFASENASLDKNLAADDLSSNSIKAVITDLMQRASQSLLQLKGAVGYRLDRRAGRAAVDSRPFQIFEGSNDILFQQITEAVVKAMRRKKETNLFRFLSSHKLTKRASGYLEKALSFDIDANMPQRSLVELGQALGRLVSMEFVVELGERGFRPDLVSNALATLRMEVEALLAGLDRLVERAVSEDNVEGARWQDYLVKG